jgi:NADPH-dependent 2,4-dienoyl-CoA reductase/sulfur reductase-like enzyme
MTKLLMNEEETAAVKNDGKFPALPAKPFGGTVSEAAIARAMIDRYWADLSAYVECDAVIVGAGSCGLSCAYHLATRHPGLKVALIEVVIFIV